MKKIYIFLLFYFLSSTISRAQVPYYYYPVPSGTTNNLYDISQYSYNNNYFICGQNGTLLKINNPDSNWVTLNSNTNVSLNGILRFDYNYYGGIYYYFGNNGIYLRGSENSISWTPLYTGFNNNLNCGAIVGIGPTQRCIAAGANGMILKKMIFTIFDTTWTLIQSGTSYNLKSIFSRDKYAWIAGEHGTILNSSDTGITWTAQSSGTTVNLKSIYFQFTLDTGFAVGDAGVILKTVNGGLNWIQKTSNTIQNLNSVNKIYNSVYIAGNKTVLISSDNGETWNNDTGVPQYNLYSFKSMNSFHFWQNVIFFVGENGMIFKKMHDTIYHPNVFITLDANNTSSYFTRYGIFDQNNANGNMAGFEWPKGSGKTAIFTAGINIAAYVNGQLREAMGSYKGEYSPGYYTNGNFFTNDFFKTYKVSKSENAQTSWDWANWGQMVPYGAPFIDVNHNGIYEPAIDTPGVANAKETIFLCMTDANPASHSSGEGFGGGTQPLGAEVHMTAWAYDTPGLQDVQFINYDIINKSTSTWNAVKMGIVSDPDLGDPNDDYNGCDTTLKLGYCYNATNNDAIYGVNPPAVGVLLLRSPLNRNVTPNVILGLTSLVYFGSASAGAPICESDPNGEPYPAYLMLSGFKKDSTCWLDPTQNPPKKTRFCYTGDPETNIGWTELKGQIRNCGHDSTGTVHLPNPPGDRKFVMGSGANNFNIIPGESQKFVIAQLIARDSGNLKSVTKLKQLTAYVRSFYENNFPINVNQISTNIPQSFRLEQNYPNPFNPITNIKYDVPVDSRIRGNDRVVLKVYDILGREVKILVNEFQSAGTFEVTFDGSNLASGVYFYKLIVGDFVSVKKMVLLK